MAVLKSILRIIMPSLLPSLALSSCYSDFDPNIDSTPVLCINATVEAGEPLKVEVTHTWRWEESDLIDKNGAEVTDATVKLYVNDNYVEDLTCREVERDPNQSYLVPQFRYMYFSDKYIPASGDVVRLEAESKQYGGASATETIPHAVGIDRVESTLSDVHVYSNSNGGIDCTFDLSMLIYFTDPADVRNFYQFNMGAWNSFMYDNETGEVCYFMYNMWDVDMTGEPLFTEHVSTLESIVAETWGYSFFSDRQISGKTYPLHVKINDCSLTYYNPENKPDYENAGLEFELMSLSQSYYNHVLSVWEANDGIVGSLGSVGLGEAVPPYSNVSSHAGIVAGCAGSKVRLSIPLILKEYLDLKTQQ
ncbi:MAG: DUF4249 domain-containing protein [Muribaculaceae bacterium]|nr:DUF4249 domain-containing protein [Muribaculaceae bacterium]